MNAGEPDGRCTKWQSPCREEREKPIVNYDRNFWVAATARLCSPCTIAFYIFHRFGNSSPWLCLTVLFIRFECDYNGCFFLLRRLHFNHNDKNNNNNNHCNCLIRMIVCVVTSINTQQQQQHHLTKSKFQLLLLLLYFKCTSKKKNTKIISVDGNRNLFHLLFIHCGNLSNERREKEQEKIRVLVDSFCM